MRKVRALLRRHAAHLHALQGASHRGAVGWQGLLGLRVPGLLKR
jgi:hypothetical protein